MLSNLAKQRLLEHERKHNLMAKMRTSNKESAKNNLKPDRIVRSLETTLLAIAQIATKEQLNVFHEYL